MSLERLRDRAVGAYERLSPRDRRALRLGVLLLGPALLWAAVIRPYVRVLGDIEDRLVSERALLEREKSVLAEGPTLPARLEAARAELARADARFVRSANPALAEAEVTALLGAVARESRVLLQDVRATAQPRDFEPPAGLLPIRLRISGESDFEGVLRFLSGMEEDPVLLRIVGLQVQPAQGTGGGGNDSVQPGTMTFEVIVEAYAPDEGGESAL